MWRRRLDTDDFGWRHRMRDPANWHRAEAISQLASMALAADPTVQLLGVLGERLDAIGLDATAFMKQVQSAHPDSFYANLALADTLRRENAAEAIRYYQAALALRPPRPLRITIWPRRYWRSTEPKRLSPITGRLSNTRAALASSTTTSGSRCSPRAMPMKPSRIFNGRLNRCPTFPRGTSL